MTPNLITIPTIEDISRRTFITGAFASALLIACGDSDEDDSSGAAATTIPTTRVVRDVYGNDIEVPANPKRVIAADNLTLPWLLELGIVPVAAGSTGTASNSGRDFPQALYELGADSVKPFTRDQPDYEMLVGLQPDLVIGSQFAVEGRVADKGDGYRKLAPTVVFDSTKGPISQLEEVARILGLEAKAKAIIETFEAETRKLAAAAKVKTLSVARTAGTNVFIFTAGDANCARLENLLGVTVVPASSVANNSNGLLIVSDERLNEASGEALFELSQPGVPGLATRGTYAVLPSVRAGRVFTAGESSASDWSGTGGLTPMFALFSDIARFLAA